jgi:pilus assembly protein CpaB
MNVRALAIALVVAVLGGVLLVLYLRRFEEEASGGERVKLVTVVKPIKAGTVITEDALSTRLVPRAYVEDRAVLDVDRPKIIGLRAGNSVEAQQTLMWTDLSITHDESRNLSALVQPGMRAVNIRAVNHNIESFALLRPGDRVDVIATMAKDGSGPGQSSEARWSVVVLQNVLVLAVGGDTDAAEKTPGGGGGSKREMILSLSLNLPEAQLLTLAMDKGKLSVALRNPDDVRVTEGMADMSSSALIDTKARNQVQGIRRAGPQRIEGSAP